MALYKNWPEICKIGYREKHLMLVLASLPLSEENDILTGLYVGFPQCFSETPVEGPFPLSFIRSLAAERALSNQSMRDGAEFPESYDILRDLRIPYISFEVLPEGETETETGWPIFPLPFEEVHEKLKQGEIYEWEGKRLVVMECNTRPGKWSHLHLAPADCIAVDL